MNYYVTLEKCGIRFQMELPASCETDARRKVEEAILLYDETSTQTKVIDVQEKNTVLNTFDAG